MHHEEIISMCQHPGGDIMATGSKANKPGDWPEGKAYNSKNELVDIKVWKSSTLELLIEIRGFHKGNLRLLAFSPDGHKLLSVGSDQFYSVAVYDWVSGTILASAKVFNKIPYSADWKTDEEFTITGNKYIVTFVQNGTNLVRHPVPVLNMIPEP
jgi:WD40 repeat protein